MGAAEKAQEALGRLDGLREELARIAEAPGAGDEERLDSLLVTLRRLAGDPLPEWNAEQVQAHMIEEHGWPRHKVEAGRFVDFMNPGAGRTAIPDDELRIKHEAEHGRIGPKFRDRLAHTHAEHPAPGIGSATGAATGSRR